MDSAREIHNEVNLKELWEGLVRRKWIVAGCLLICIFGAAAGGFLITPIYRATATIVVEGENPDLSAQQSYSEGIGGFQIYETYIETQMVLIKSRRVAERVFDDFGLQKTKYYEGEDDPFKAFLKDIHLKRTRGTRLVSISVDNPDAELAAKLANRLAEVYSENNLRNRALTFIQNQRMAYLNTEYLRLQTEYDNLSLKHSPDDPKMISIQEAINGLARRIRLFKSLDQTSSRPKDHSETAGTQGSLDNLLSEIQESSVILSARMNNVVIQDHAKVPNEIFKPNRKKSALIGFLAGIVLGIFFALLIDCWDDTVKNEQDVKRYIGDVPFLGTIPFIKESKGKGSTRESKIDHITAIEPESISAEAYRLIRTNLLWSTEKEKLLKDFAVLSPSVGEGKTTVSSNLAITLSQLGKRTLLVDTDIRRGRLHDSYGISNSMGLGHFLMEEAPLEEIIQSTTIPHLSLVTCGKSIIDPSRLLSSPQMSAFVRETRKNFDIVVYDTPPLMLISDASILISLVSSVVLDLRRGMTVYSTISKALEIIKASNTQLIGVILDGSRYAKKNYDHYYKQHSRWLHPPPHLK